MQQKNRRTTEVRLLRGRRAQKTGGSGGRGARREKNAEKHSPHEHYRRDTQGAAVVQTPGPRHEERTRDHAGRGRTRADTRLQEGIVSDARRVVVKFGFCCFGI